MGRTYSRSPSSRKASGLHRAGALRRSGRAQRGRARSGARARSRGTTGVSVSGDENIMRETDRA